MTSRSCSLVTTPNETPRTTPLTAIQPFMLPPDKSTPSNSESSRQTDDGRCGVGADRGDGQTASVQKQTPHLLPADNFGLLSPRGCVYTVHVDFTQQLIHCVLLSVLQCVVSYQCCSLAFSAS